MKNKIYTHDIAAQMVDLFEDLLDRKNITVPCSDENEEADRSDIDNSARLYGSEYSELLDDIEATLIGVLEEKDSSAEVILYEFSGTV